MPRFVPVLDGGTGLAPACDRQERCLRWRRMNDSEPQCAGSSFGKMPLDAIKQGLGFERLPEKAFGAHRDRLVFQMPIRQSRDEDDRGPAVLSREFSCEV